ncbi:MAG: hypothetical protein ACXWT3_10880 [Methylococcaceae bacterium]
MNAKQSTAALQALRFTIETVKILMTWSKNPVLQKTYKNKSLKIQNQFCSAFQYTFTASIAKPSYEHQVNSDTGFLYHTAVP